MPGVICIAGLVSFKTASISFTGLAEAVGTMFGDISGGDKVAGAKMARHMAKGNRPRCSRRYGSLVSDSMMLVGPRAALASITDRCY